jgi:DNA-binding beta-propeller fold protein YncE
MNPTRWSAVIGLVAIGIFTGVSAPVCRADGTYHFLKEIPVSGGGGWDCLSIDEAARRLYVSHATKVVVIDIDKNTVVGEIADTPGVHGLAVVPLLQRGFTSNGKENKASIVDLMTLKTLSKVDTGENPDIIMYEPGQEEVYAFNGKSHSATVIEPKSGKVVATIPLSGKPEFGASDPAAGRVYCNMEDKSVVDVIDTKTHKVVSSWPIAPGDEPTGLAIDRVHHRLFISCHSEVMVMMDSTTGKVITTVPIGAEVDGTEFDPGTQLAFSSNGGATVTIAHEDSPDKLTVVQTLKTEDGARTMALDTTTHRIYLATAKFGSETDAKGRPKMIPGTFKILVYGM